MGAEQFIERSSGKTAQEAFTNAVTQAQYDFGHNGYSGSIAEKDSFFMVPYTGTPEEAEDKAYSYMDNMDNREFVKGKWEEASCFDLGDGYYMFFGYASS